MTLKELLDFHIEINKLKQTTRYSTCQESVQESTADHSWKLAFLVLDTINALNLDVDPIYCVKLALTHDLCEYKLDHDVDSIEIAQGKVLKEDKHNSETEVINELVRKFGREDIYNIWIDFEETRTPEAKYVKAMDKIESLIHLVERGDRGRNYDDGDHIAFYADKAVLAFPELKPLLREVKSKIKTVFNKQGFEWKPEYDNV